MAKIPGKNRFSIEGYKDVPGWFTRFLDELNTFSEGISLAVAGNLTFLENMAARVVDANIAAGAAATDNTVEISLPEGRIPLGVLVLQATQTSDTLAVNSSAIWPDWRYLNGAVSIRAITGLTNGTKYLIRFLVIYR